jgi:hypothetical protein
MWPAASKLALDVIRRARSRQALLFLTHIESERLLAHFQRLRRETEGLLDCFLCVHEPQRRHPAERVLPADLRIGRDDAAHYAGKRYDEMLQAKRSFNSGYTDLAYMPALANERFRLYRYLWIIEYDVDYSGNWANFFADAMLSRADFIATTLVPRSNSQDWAWWPDVRTPPDVTPEHQFRSFAPIARFSQPLLERYQAAVVGGAWRGHSEALFPTIAAHAGLTVEDLRRGTHYTNTPDDWTLSPGTLVFRPAVAAQYFHENPGGFAEPNLLYHPVKPVLK